MREMPKSRGFPPRAGDDRLVLFVAFDDMCVLDLTGPMTVFWVASKAMRERGRRGYWCDTVSIPGGPVLAAEGVTLQSRPVSDFASAAIDTVVLPGSFAMRELSQRSHPLVAWLREVSTGARRIASVCTGAFLLAEAGLLRGKRVATHWLTCDLLKERFPDIHVDHDSIFVRHGSIWTSAGVTAGIDLALALVEEDCGRDVAMNVARELVVFLRRSGGQSQFSQLLASQSSDSGTFDDLHHWIADNLAREDLTVEELAEQACMSPRNFARIYKQKTGRTPAKAIELFRLEAARRLLETTGHNFSQVARLCGFGDEGRMRGSFVRHLAVTPREYRHRFAAAAAPAV